MGGIQNESSESANAPISSERRWLWALIGLTLVVFAYSAIVRWPYLDDMGTIHHQWLTSITVNATRNWLNEGAWSDAFLMLEDPASAEFSTIRDRSPYLSFPSGTIIPVWIFAKLLSLGSVDQLVFLTHSINLFSQLLISLLLGISSYWIFRCLKIDSRMSFSLSLATPIAWILLPSHMWWGQQVYFADQAIILPVALLIFLEVLRLRPHHISNTSLEWLITLVGFWACFTDWYGVVAVATLFIKRLLDGTWTDCSWHQRLRQGARFLAGPFTAMALWVYQIWLTGRFAKVWERFSDRSRGELPKGSFNIITDWIPQSYSWIGFVILVLSILTIVLIWLMWKQERTKNSEWDKLRSVNCISGWVFFSCILYTFILWSNCSVHDLTAYKYGICLSLISFGAIPATILAMRPLFNKERVTEMTPRRCRFVIFAILGPILAFVLPLHTHWQDFGYFEFQQETVYDWALEDTLDDLTEFEDVVFSTDYEVPTLPPFKVSRTTKRVYLAEDYADMRAILDPIEGGYNVCLFYPSDDPGWMSWAAGLANEIYSVEGYTLARVDKAVWLNYLAEVDS